MADQPRYSDTGAESGGEPSTGTPRWVKVFGVIALVVVLLFDAMLLTHGPGRGHGPGRHASPSGRAEHGARSP